MNRSALNSKPPPMRVSPVSFAFNSVDEVLKEAKRSAEVTHNQRFEPCQRLWNKFSKSANVAVTQKWVLPKERPENAPVDSKVVLPKVP
jgi:ribosomal protein L1